MKHILQAVVNSFNRTNTTWTEHAKDDENIQTKYSNKAVSFAVRIIDDLDNLDPTTYAIEHMLTHKLLHLNSDYKLFE